MKLHPMSSSEYDLWAPRSRAGYAEDKIRANGYTSEEASKIATDDFKRLLPDGLKSKDNFLFTAKNESEILGFVWFCIRGPEDNRRAFVCDVLIEEEFRGKGHGREMMTLLEAEIRKQGLKRVGLHVFGFNERAIGLYKSLGYQTTDLQMEKSLT